MINFPPIMEKPFFFIFFFLWSHICTTSPNPQTWHQAAFSASCRTLLTPKNLQKFQFSAHKGILNSLHTPSQEVLPFQNLSQDYSGKIKTFSGIRGHWMTGKAGVWKSPMSVLKIEKKNPNYWILPEFNWMCLLTVLPLFSRHRVTIFRGL